MGGPIALPQFPTPVIPANAGIYPRNGALLSHRKQSITLAGPTTWGI